MKTRNETCILTTSLVKKWVKHVSKSPEIIKIDQADCMLIQDVMYPRILSWIMCKTDINHSTV